MGNPNAGKSVLFSRLTGVRVLASNYPGTTVEYTRGKMLLGGKPATLIDVPGTYSLEPTSPAEEVAAKMFEQGDKIVCVLDSTNLERHLYLALSVIEQGKPTVVALNMWDEAKKKGIVIDVEKL
ncbi:MAG: FeoB small GTPase domain-containing protein, partial [Candidatus Thermoplasmatota archaeon]|nr:FeoB small GTPase domain-containing protein [Candidatus Thermoplasmatota archaeon]